MGVKRVGSASLRAYALVYSALALKEAGAAGTLDVLARILRLHFPNEDNPAFSKRSVGYSRVRDALWVKPHQVFATRRSALTSLVDEVGLETPSQVFYESRTLVPALRALATRSDVDPPATISARDVLSPEQLDCYFAIAGSHAPTTLPYCGPLLVGHDPSRERGVFWLGVREHPRRALQPEAAQWFWLKHDAGILEYLQEPSSVQLRSLVTGAVDVWAFGLHYFPELLRSAYRELLQAWWAERGCEVSAGPLFDVVQGAALDGQVRDWAIFYLPYFHGSDVALPGVTARPRSLGGLLRDAFDAVSFASAQSRVFVFCTEWSFEDVEDRLSVACAGLRTPLDFRVRVVDHDLVKMLVGRFRELGQRYEDLLREAERDEPDFLFLWRNR